MTKQFVPGIKSTPTALALRRSDGRRVQRGASTSVVNLEVRRHLLGERIQRMLETLVVTAKQDSTPEEKNQALNVCSILGMLGCVEGLALIVDCLTSREKTGRDEKTGKVKHIRHSVGGEFPYIAGDVCRVWEELERHSLILTDIAMKDPVPKHYIDENGVIRSPWMEFSDGAKRGTVVDLPEDESEAVSDDVLQELAQEQAVKEQEIQEGLTKPKGAAR